MFGVPEAECGQLRKERIVEKPRRRDKGSGANADDVGEGLSSGGEALALLPRIESEKLAFAGGHESTRQPLPQAVRARGHAVFDVTVTMENPFHLERTIAPAPFPEFGIDSSPMPAVKIGHEQVRDAANLRSRQKIFRTIQPRSMCRRYVVERDQ